MGKEFNIKKNDLLLMLLYAQGSSGKYNEPIRGVTRLMKLIFLVNEGIKNPEKFNFEAYKMGPYSSDVYSALNFFSTFPSPDNPILHIKRSNSRLLDADSVKYILDSVDDESSLEDGFGNNARFCLSERGRKLAKLLWDNADKEEKQVITNVKKRFSSLPLKDLLRYVYDTFPKMTTESIIRDQIYE